MAQETGTSAGIEVGPQARAAAIELAAAVRAAVRDLAADAEPAAFAPMLERLADGGNEG